MPDSPASDWKTNDAETGPVTKLRTQSDIFWPVPDWDNRIFVNTKKGLKSSLVNGNMLIAMLTYANRWVWLILEKSWRSE
jgi:hypothetical protein